MIQAISANWGTIATLLLAVSEALALIPGIKSNGIVMGIINFMKDAFSKPAPKA